MKAEGKKHRARSMGLIPALLMLICALSLTAPANAYAESATGAQSFDIMVYVRIAPAETGVTPDPGAAVFHFDIWSEAGVPLTITNNAVYTTGFGSYEGHLTFTVATPYDARMVMAEGLVVQQYDGNENWIFDTEPAIYYWSNDAGSIVPGGSGVFANVYSPVTPAPVPTEPAPALPERITFSIPAVVNIARASESVPDPGQNVFHFNVWSDSGADIQLAGNAVYTNGTGEFRGDLVFTVPSSQLEALKTTTLRVTQFSGNADWVFDSYVFEFFFDPDYGTFVRWPRMDGSMVPPRVKTTEVVVTNTYAPAVSTPAPTQPAPTEPAPTEPAPTQPDPTEPAPTQPAESVRVEEKPAEIIESEGKVQFTLPVYVDVKKYGQDAPPPAVFHFGLYGMQSDQKYEWVNDIITTQGEGMASGSISFTVPAGAQLDQLIETGFDVRERSAAVPGWSFAGEVYHIALTREDGTLKADIQRRRRVTTAESGLKVMVFRNYYGMKDGQPEAMPASPIGLDDMIREILGLRFIIIRDTFHIYDKDGIWELNWRALKQGNTVGDVALNIGYAKKGEAYSVVNLSDVLRVTEEGIFIRLGSIADACKQLSGKEFPAAEAIPESEWTAFTQETISWLQLSALDDLFRRMWNDAGRVFDEMSAECTRTGYKMTAGSADWSSIKMEALNAAQLNHADWYALSQKAAESQDMKDLAASYEDAFTEFCSQEMNNAGLMSLLNERYPAILDHFALSIEHQQGDSYSSSLSAGFSDGRSFDSILITETSSVQAVNMTAPESFESGSDYLYELIMMLALKGGQEENTQSAGPGQDQGGDASDPESDPESDPKSPPDSANPTASDAKLKCTVRQNTNKTYSPADNGLYYAGQDVAVWVDVSSPSGNIMKDIKFYDADTGELILYDGHIYPRPDAGTPWKIEELESGEKATLMYYHVITGDEALAKKFVFSVYAEGKDTSGNTVTSKTARFEAATSGTYTPNWWEIEKPRPTELTLDFHESSQAGHWSSWHSYYGQGEMIRFKVNIRNETGNPFFDVDIGLEGDSTVLYHMDMLQFGTEDFFTFEIPAKCEVTDGSQNTMKVVIWVSRRDAYGKRETFLSDPCIINTKVIH